MGAIINQTMQMKATLCVFVALVAVTSAAPTFMQSNRRNAPAACTADAFCGAQACTCVANGNGDCVSANNAVPQYCKTGNVKLTQCTGTGGTTGALALSADCACGATTVTFPASINTAKIAPMPAGICANDVVGFCLLNKPDANNNNAPTQASTSTCPSATATNVLNAKATCGTGLLNACEKDKACVGGECLP